MDDGITTLLSLFSVHIVHVRTSDTTFCIGMNFMTKKPKRGIKHIPEDPPQFTEFKRARCFFVGHQLINNEFSKVQKVSMTLCLRWRFSN